MGMSRLSRLSRSDRLALVFFFATACLGFLAWAFPNMSRVVTIPGAIFSFCFMLYFLWPEIKLIYNVRRHRMIPLFGMIISAISFTMFAAWYFWPVQLINTSASNPLVAPVTEKTPEETPLPPNAKFKYKDKIFWVISRPYTKAENADIRTALREVYDCINTQSEPIIANYDGSAQMFTREWLSIIDRHGAESAIKQLDDIRNKVRFAYAELQTVLKRRPYFQQDIRAIIDDRGEVGNMNGSLNDYIEALKSVPHGASQQLIKLVVANSEAKFEDAIKNYSGWIGRFNNKMMVAKDDLDRLMTIE